MSKKTVTNAEFARQYASVSKTLYAYIFSLIPNPADADDVMQETAVALWSKADQYDPERAFLNWAMTFARIQAQQFRTYNARHRARTVALSDEAFVALAEAEYDWARTAERDEAIVWCLEQLESDSRELIRRHYEQGQAISKIAGDDDKLQQRLYKRVQKLRTMLADCVLRRLSEFGTKEDADG